jgi:hypothetical protein
LGLDRTGWSRREPTDGLSQILQFSDDMIAAFSAACYPLRRQKAQVYGQLKQVENFTFKGSYE